MALAITLAVVELFVRDDLVWKWVSVGVTTLMMTTLPWRRVYPLPMMCLAFGANTIVQLLALFAGVVWTGLFTSVIGLLLLYALFRWASGKAAFVGLAFVYVTFALTIGLSDAPLNEIVAGNLFLLFPAALGALVRYKDSADRRAIEQIQLREREQLARELHDTVAHHVSAIAIQAQAGQAMVASQPQAPLEALAVIEQAASSTLAEMRRIVRAMRDDSPGEFAPAASLADIEKLADGHYPLNVELRLSGDMDDLDTATVATLYRLTQESITNAVRHAQGATTLRVQIVGDTSEIRLMIEDDGKALASRPPPGLGLQGMAERAALLGGSLTAGPGEQRGWIVNVTLPRTMSPA